MPDIKIRNMNYYFNKQYFDGLVVEKAGDKLQIELDPKKSQLGDFETRNQQIKSYAFFTGDDSSRPSDIGGTEQFQLITTYPGLLMGTGYAHDLKNDEAIKCGFSFDYVSGLPYLPGSSLKGMLRSCFPGGTSEEDKNKERYIKELLGCADDVNIEELKNNIFDGGDTFLDVFPCSDGEKKLLEYEFITPHNKGEFASPIPIKLIKVKPNVKFMFCFLLKDYVDAGKIRVTKEEKLKLFKNLILDMGIGAKTNIGFGKFVEEKIPYARNREQIPQPTYQSGNQNKNMNKVIPGKCKYCGKKTDINRKYNTYFAVCRDCANKGLH